MSPKEEVMLEIGQIRNAVLTLRTKLESVEFQNKVGFFESMETIRELLKAEKALAKSNEELMVN